MDGVLTGFQCSEFNVCVLLTKFDLIHTAEDGNVTDAYRRPFRTILDYSLQKKYFFI